MPFRRTDRGTLIAFEGIDGAGKTTQIALFEELLRSCGVPVVRSKEPTDGPWGQKIRRSAANGRMSPVEELNALIEDRREHVRALILPSLEAGSTVLLDRYFYSTIAYQGANAQQAAAISTAMIEEFPAPDAVVLIDVPPAVGVSRITDGRGESPNTFEGLDNLRAVREAFLRIANDHDNVLRIDGTRGIEDVRRAVAVALIEGPLKARLCAKEYGCDGWHCVHRETDSCRWASLYGKSASFSGGSPIPHRAAVT